MNPTLETLAKNLADTQTALNIVWTLVAGFLVMFMQAGFALVETGLTRAKNVAHTMGDELPRLRDRHPRLLGVGLRRCRWAASARWPPSAATRRSRTSSSSHIAGKDFGLFGMKGFFLPLDRLHAGRGGDVPVPDGVHGHDRDDPDGRDGRALEVLVAS